MGFEVTKENIMFLLKQTEKTEKKKKHVPFK